MKRVFSLNSRTQGHNPVSFCWQKTHGNYLATSGADNVVCLYDRHGQQVQDIALPGMCCGFGWDNDGDVLSVISDKSSVIFLWDANNWKLSQLDSGFRDPLTCIVWARGESLLAVGTNKGNLLIYNHRTAQKIPVLGKHTKRIKCGCWSQQNLLALAGDDHTLSITNSDGDTVKQFAIQGDPNDVQFSEMKADERSSVGENTVSLIKDRKTLVLYTLHDPDNPIELAFQQRYGQIASYQWYGDGYIMIGFSHGFFVVISTHMKEIGQEIFQVRDHKENLCRVAISPSVGKAASAGDNSVRIHDLQDWKQMYAIVTLDDERSLDNIEWTDDGQLMAVSSPRGTLHVYLTELPVIGASCGTRIAYLTSLLEITLQDSVQLEQPVSVSVDVEPSFLSLGPYNVVVGMNNRAWFYSFTDSGRVQILKEREYMGTIQECKINADYAAVRFDGRVNLHLIDESGVQANTDRESRMFPDNRDRITCHDITRDFLIYATDKGKLSYFALDDWSVACELDHSSSNPSGSSGAGGSSVIGIRKLFADPSGCRVVYIDDKADAFLYCPVNESVLEIPQVSPKTVGVLWDYFISDKGVFVMYDRENIKTYLYERDSIAGGRVVYVGESRLPFGQEPLLLYGGGLTLQTSSGSVQAILLDTHSFMSSEQQTTTEQKISAVQKCIALKRFQEAWRLCEDLQSIECWQQLANAALCCLDIDFAIRVYRVIGDVGMVMALQTIRLTEDRSLLAGYVSMFLGNFNAAQDLFLASSRPVAALEMRRDLMNWDTALQLARSLASDEIPSISREYAQQLEFTGDYQAALRHYESAVTRDPALRDHDEACAAGVARMAIRNGDLRRGVSMAVKMPSPTLKKECAAILESMKQYSESASLYEKGEFYDKAASVYIRAKNWSKVSEMLPHVTAPKIHSQYARAREAEGRYKEAVVAYQNAKDWDSVIRVYLDHLHNADEAVRVVRATQSVDGAKMVAKFFEKLKDYSSAIQFLVMSKCNDEAFQMAQRHGHMEKYAEIIGPDATAEDYRSIAVHFESEKNHFLAGKFYYLSGQYAKALNHLLSIPDDDSEENSKSLNLAVDVVGAASDVKLTKHLMDYLLGDVDGTPKDPKFLFRLYMALKHYRDAARTASVIAREEQNAGSYRTAHDLLFSMYQELKKNRIKIPADMSTSLTILHSYILVKMHIKRNDHLKAARMLIRVANNISKFPSHIVQILTSAVIECHRAGLRNSAFSFAAMLMRPEYRDQIHLNYKKKLEDIVRKPDKSELDEPTSPCPYCDAVLVETELVCSGCKNNIPFCIATGRHIVKNQMTACPSCQFPAIMSEFMSLLSSEGGRCPMCSEKVKTEDVVELYDVTGILYQQQDAIE